MAGKENIMAERVGGRLTISLDNPPHNTLTEEMMSEIRDELEKIRGDDDLKLIVFSSTVPNVFSRGFDRKQRLPERIGPLMAAFGHMLYLLNEIPVMVAAEVQGECIGSGMELAMFCDMVICSSTSKFGHPEVRMGVFPPIAAAVYPHLIGRNQTMEILATGSELAAEKAYNMGLVNHVWSDREFRERADRFYHQIESRSAVALRLTKKAIEQSLYEKVLVAIRTTENIYLNELLASHDAREGITAALEGRDPKWTNR